MNEMEQIENREVGNSETSLPKKQRETQSKHWCFTLNNWSRLELESMEQQFKTFAKRWIIGDEIGESGTPHLQGYVEFKLKRRLTEVKKINDRIHWEKTNNVKASIIYCAKDGVFTLHGITRDEIAVDEVYIGADLPKRENLYKWQTDILELIKQEAHARTVHWYWEDKGGAGKSDFAKYLIYHHNAMVCQKGKYADIMNAAYNHKSLKIMVIDVPRNSMNKVSYSAIESIKSGIIVNTKYETGQKLINKPHVIVFANCPPDLSQLSADRWNIRNIEGMYAE